VISKHNRKQHNQKQHNNKNNKMVEQSRIVSDTTRNIPSKPGETEHRTRLTDLHQSRDNENIDQVKQQRQADVSQRTDKPSLDHDQINPQIRGEGDRTMNMQKGL
jgi:hypothetical protein